MPLHELVAVDPENILLMLKDYALLHGVVYLFGKVVRPSRHLVRSEWDRMLHGHKLYGHKGPALKCQRVACARIRTSYQQETPIPIQDQQLLPEISLEDDR